MPSAPVPPETAAARPEAVDAQIAAARRTIYATPAETIAALEPLQAGLRESVDAGARRALAATLDLLCIGRRLLGEYATGLKENAEARDLYVALGDEAGVAKACILGGNLHFCMGGFDAALEAFEEGLALRRKLGDRKGEAGALGSIGAVLDELGRLDDARRCYEESLALSRELGDRMFEARTLNNLGETHLKLGDGELAEAQCAAALARFRELGERVEAVHALNNLGRVAEARGRLAEAREHFAEVIATGAQLGDRGVVADARHLLGRLLARPDTGFQSLDESRRELAAARTEAQALGASRLQAEIGRSLAEVLAAAGDPAAALDCLREAGALERTLHTAQMERRLAHLQAAFGLDQARRELEAERERARALADLNRDLDAQKQQLDAAVRRLLRLDRERSDLLSTTAHDVKSPLASIIALADEQLADPGGATARSAVADIRALAQSTLELVGNILETSAIEHGRRTLLPVSTDVAVVLQTVFQDHAERAAAKRLDCTCDTPPGGLPVFTDPLCLRRIFDNLISNAIKYTPAGGRVQVRGKPEDGAIVVEIADSGPGFTPADFGRMFERFARLSARPTDGESSTGLGLYIAKRLAADLRGDLTCRSAPGQGATFTFRLPVSPKAK